VVEDLGHTGILLPRLKQITSYGTSTSFPKYLLKFKYTLCQSLQRASKFKYTL
jgi:hypothetical protein